MAGTTSDNPSWDYVLLMAILLVGAGSVMAADPDPLQDFCVADLSPIAPLVNDHPCKPRSCVSAQEFFCNGFQKAGDGGGSKWNPPKRSMSMTKSSRAANSVRDRSSGAADSVEFRYD